MQPVPYLFFRGDCAEALGTYARVFGSPEPDLMGVSSMPEEARGEMAGVPGDAVLHGAVRVGDGWIFGSDDMSDNAPPPMQGSSIAVSLPSLEAARLAFDMLAEGGEVRMALAPTFFAPAFGTLSDRWGTRWMIMADAPDQGT